MKMYVAMLHAEVCCKTSATCLVLSFTSVAARKFKMAHVTYIRLILNANVEY